MTTAKHTPGTWTVKKYDSIFVIESDGMRVLSTSWHSSIRKPYPLKDEALANAILASAALELQEALKGAIGALEFSRDYHADLSNAEQAFAQDRLDAALAALAKAEGQP